ncbi:hypothetical protein Mapa_004992 [Marchantia paleacea]|nr:hypothetical protein Mapa_004992 [Marchantia paleacea]
MHNPCDDLLVNLRISHHASTTDLRFPSFELWFNEGDQSRFRLHGREHCRHYEKDGYKGEIKRDDVNQLR